ncbi:MAG: pitrilysin family protein [Candidatus Omnitrophota bacterium]
MKLKKSGKKLKYRAVNSFILICIILTALFYLFTDSLYANTIPDFEDSKPLHFTLENGLRIILKQDKKTPTFAAALFVKTGSATEIEFSGSGITHFIEHLIFKGTENRDGLKLQQELRAYGAEVNAATSHDYTCFQIQGPVTNVEPILNIFHDIISNPAFDEKEFQKEKDVVIREMKMCDDSPDKYLSRKFWEEAYLIHPYKNPVIGYEDIFKELDTEDVRRYYNKYYVTDNMVLAIVGDIDTKLLEQKVSETFSRIRRKSFLQQVLPQEPKQLNQRYQEIPYATSKTSLMIGFHTTDFTHKDMYALDTLALLLGEGRSSILYKKLHNQEKCVLAVNAFNYSPFYPGIFGISATLDYENKGKVLQSILAEIDNVKNESFTKKDLEKSKNQAISSYIFSKQTQLSQAENYGISMLATGSTDYLEHYVEGVNAVTEEDIKEVANKYLTNSNMTTVMLIPKDKATTAEGKDKEEKLSKETIKFECENGVRILLTEDNSLPLVSINISLEGGLRAETKSNNGISKLTASLLTKGTKEHSEEEIFELVETMGGNLSSYSGNNSIGISLDLLSKDIEQGLELLAEIITTPTFPKEKLEILKADTLDQIDLINEDIFTSTNRRLNEKLFKNNPYGMISTGTEETVKDITQHQISSFYNKLAVSSNIVISIYGNANIENVKKTITSRFRKIKEEPALLIKKSKLTKIPDQIQIIHKMNKKQALIMIGFRSAGINNEDKYPLQILSALYSGIGGKLFEDIRQKKGLAYTLGTFGMSGIETGTFIFYAATSVDKIDMVKDKLIDEINLSLNGKITDDDINAAKKNLLFNHELNLQSATALSQRIGLDELYGLGYDNYKQYPMLINNTTREEIIQAANKYFTIGNCVISITIPEND